MLIFGVASWCPACTVGTIPPACQPRPAALSTWASSQWAWVAQLDPHTDTGLLWLAGGQGVSPVEVLVPALAAGQAQLVPEGARDHQQGLLLRFGCTLCTAGAALKGFPCFMYVCVCVYLYNFSLLLFVLGCWTFEEQTAKGLSLLHFKLAVIKEIPGIFG